jgi:hypothetical protein
LLVEEAKDLRADVEALVAIQDLSATGLRERNDDLVNVGGRFGWEKDNPLAEVNCLVEFMGDQENGGTRLSPVSEKSLLHGAAHAKIESTERLVHEQEGWSCDECTGDAQELLLAHAKLVHAGVEWERKLELADERGQALSALGRVGNLTFQREEKVSLGIAPRKERVLEILEDVGGSAGARLVASDGEATTIGLREACEEV